MEKEMSALDYGPLEKSVARLVEGRIYYEVKPNWGNGFCETEANATLYWDKEKGKWLAEVSGKFLEGYERGEQVFLDFSHELLTLNQSACRKLLEAYGIDDFKVNLSDVPELEPSRLESLAGMGKQQAQGGSIADIRRRIQDYDQRHSELPGYDPLNPWDD